MELMFVLIFSSLIPSRVLILESFIRKNDSGSAKFH